MSTATTTNCPKGSEMGLYYNTGDDTTQVWVRHVGMIEDLNMPETEDLQEMNDRREDRDVKEYNEGEVEHAITGTQKCDPDYEGWQFLNSMRRGGPSRDVMCLTGPIGTVGSYGWRGHYRNSDRTFNGPGTGDMTNAVNLQPSAQCQADWVKVRTVKIAVADTVADFDATTYEAAA